MNEENKTESEAVQDIQPKYNDQRLEKQNQNNFTYHQPKDQVQIRKYEDVRNAFHGLATFINAVVPDSREKSVAITKLEEAMFWSNAGIARNE